MVIHPNLAQEATGMYDHVQLFYAEMMMRGVCKTMASTLSEQLLACRDPVAAEGISFLEKKHAATLRAAYTECRQRALDRVIQLQERPRAHKILWELYTKHPCLSTAVADMPGGEHPEVALFFKIIIGSIFVSTPSTSTSMDLWIQYPYEDRDPYRTFMLMILGDAAKRTHIVRRALPHDVWMDTATCWDNYTRIVENSTFVLPETKTLIVGCTGQLNTPMCFFDCEDPQCATCSDYEDFLAGGLAAVRRQTAFSRNREWRACTPPDH